MIESDKWIIQKTTLTAIADSVRLKTGTSAEILTENIAGEIDKIVVSEGAPAGTLKITENGLHTVIEYAEVDVEVPIPDDYVPDGYVPEGTVPDGYMPAPTEELLITENGEYDVLNFAKAKVNISVATYEISGKWVFKDTITRTSEEILQEVKFTSNNKSYTGMEFLSNLQEDGLWYVLEDDEYDEAYNALSGVAHWYDDKWKTVNFGNTLQSVSKEFYEFIATNAEIDFSDNIEEWDGSFTKITDLKGTTWEIASGWEAEAGLGQFEVDCTYEGNTYNRLGIGYSWEASLQAPFPFNNFALLYNEGTTEYAKLSSGNAYVLSITGGNDVGSATLQDWLLKYGKLQ